LRTLLKHIVAHTYKPVLVKYLSRTRIYKYGNLKLVVPPDVFHPGFFFSSQLLLKFISGIKLRGCTFLELGAGSGLISFIAAHKGAKVTATDINPVAIEYLDHNSRRNNIKIRILLSDLFTSIPKEQFDFIAINPPYYCKDPKTWIDYAWYCGKNGEYFSNLFKRLHEYICKNSTVLMVLCDGCDIGMIRSIARQYGFAMKIVLSRQNIIEKNFIYKIESNK